MVARDLARARFDRRVAPYANHDRRWWMEWIGTFQAAVASLKKMWRLVAGIGVALLLVVFSSPAAASCAPRASAAENGARAEVVVYGTATDVSGGAVTLSVDRVLKGQVGSSVRVFYGPGRGGFGGTSIDYSPDLGSDHVLYIGRGADGQLETNVCIGSHPGPPDASEVTFFGLSSSSAAPSATSAPAVEPVVPAPAVIAPAMWVLSSSRSSSSASPLF